MNLKYFAAGLISLLLSLPGFAQTLKLDEGSVLVYEVNNEGNSYDFTLTINELDPDEISFFYHMSEPAGLKGSVNITECAIDNAVIMYNYFDGANITLTKEITVWLSNALFNDLVISGSGFISTGIGEEWISMMNDGVTSLECLIGEKSGNLEVVQLSEIEGDRKIWVLNDETNPLIIKMDLGWQVELKEVK